MSNATLQNCGPVLDLLTAEKEGLRDMSSSMISRVRSILSLSQSVDEARNSLQITDEKLSEDCWNDDTILDCLEERKMWNPIDDSTVTECLECCTPFTLFNRKHHCRCCGRVFCGRCSRYSDSIPEDIISYKSFTKWKTTEPSRTCRKCKDVISYFKSIEHIVRYLEIVTFPFELCVRAASLSNAWREAVRLYMSSCFDIQRSTPTKLLEEREKSILVANIENIGGHNKWILQFLKMGCVNYSKVRTSSCRLMGCDESCSPDITVKDSLIILNSPVYNNQVKNHAMNVIRANRDVDPNLIPFLPVEIKAVQEFVVRSPKYFDELFWISRIHGSDKRTDGDVFSNKIMLSDPLNAINVQESLRLVSILDNYSVKTLNMELSVLNTPFKGPFHVIDGFDNNFVIKNSSTAPILLSYISSGQKRQMLYKRDDVRKDMYIISLINIMCDLVGMDRKYVSTYRAVPASVNSGFIEVVPNSTTVADVLSRGTVSNHLFCCNKNSTISVVVDNYTNSLAFWTVVTYLLGIGDRHLENIMIRDDGVLFHIDYGFIFGKDTTSTFVRIDSDLIEGIGGKSMYEPFKKKCTDIYSLLRKDFPFICACSLRLATIRPSLSKRFTTSFIEEFLSERFSMGQTDREAVDGLSTIIDISRDHIINKVSDAMHSAVASFKITLWS